MNTYFALKPAISSRSSKITIIKCCDNVYENSKTINVISFAQHPFICNQFIQSTGKKTINFNDVFCTIEDLFLNDDVLHLSDLAYSKLFCEMFTIPSEDVEDVQREQPANQRTSSRKRKAVHDPYYEYYDIND